MFFVSPVRLGHDDYFIFTIFQRHVSNNSVLHQALISYESILALASLPDYFSTKNEMCQQTNKRNPRNESESIIAVIFFLPASCPLLSSSSPSACPSLPSSSREDLSCLVLSLVAMEPCERNKPGQRCLVELIFAVEQDVSLAGAYPHRFVDLSLQAASKAFQGSHAKFHLFASVFQCAVLPQRIFLHLIS